MRNKTSILTYLLPLFWILTSVSIRVHAQSQDIALDTDPVNLDISAGVSSIFQDKTGFIWIGTYSGLYMYDGYNLVLYRHESDDSTSLADNRISVLYEDKEGVLWAGTWVSLEKFDRMNRTFSHFIPNPLAIESHEGNFVYSIYEDRNGNFWVGTLQGLYQFDRVTEKFTSVLHDCTASDDLTHSAVLVIYEDKEGGLWFGTRAGLQKYNSTTGTFKHVLKDSGYEVLSIFEDESRTFWLATDAGLKAFSPGEGTCATYRYAPEGRKVLFEAADHIRSITPGVRPGLLRLETDQGLFSFDTHSKTFVRWHVEGRKFFMERSGALLLAAGRGVKKFVLAKPPFKEYSLQGNAIISEIAGRQGALWVFGSGWHAFDMKAEQFVPRSFGGDQLYFVYGQAGVHMAFLTKDGSFCIRDSLGNKTFHLDLRWQKLYRKLTSGCRTDRGYYVGTDQGGVYLFDPRTNGVSEVCNLRQMIVWIHEDRLGFIWVATVMGKLVRYDQVQGTITEISHDKNNPSSWCGNPVNWMHEDSKGRVWIATSYGLDKYDPATNCFVHFTEKNGLLGNNVRGVAEDDHGCLWVSTTRGISKLNPETGTFKNYDASCGFTPADDFIWGGVAKGENGEMYVGGGRGLIRFHPDSLHDNLFIPPVVITSFRIFDRVTPLFRDIRLPHDENSVSFEFAALSYVSPERNQYAYKMEGVDRDWVYSGTRRYVSYANLSPGEYSFRVKGSNNEGVWNEIGTSVAITITPPWWKSSVAYAFYGLAILGTLYATWKLQMRRIRIRHAYEMSRFEAEKLHEVDVLKSRFFANISHEFRTPLTLILGPIKQLAEESGDKESRKTLEVVHRNASKLLNLVNELLDLSKLESGNMTLQTSLQDIVSLLRSIPQTFCSYAERKCIDLDFHSDTEELAVYVDREKIEKIFANVLSNALKFTPERGKIEVSIAHDMKYVTVRISDTGIGIPGDKVPLIFDRFYQVDSARTREQEGTGIGLSLTKELVELHKGRIDVESEEGRGTTVTVRLPLGKAHLKPEEISSTEEENKFPGSREVRTEIAETQKAPTQRGSRHGAGEESGKPLVLVVEDNADVRTYIRNNLTDDWRVLEAKNGEEGWNMSIEKMPDLIVSDVMMPKMDGFQLCDKLKSDERTSHIPVILLTAKAASQDKIDGFERGADDYTMKPFEPAELRARIKNLLEQRKRLHEHFRKHGLFELEEQKVTPVDQRFIEKVFAMINEHISDTSFSVELLADCMAVSRSLLLKKLEALTGEAPLALIRRIRLEKGARLLEGGFGNISEVALEVGFNNPSYFTECFKRQFGVSPKKYQHKQ